MLRVSRWQSVLYLSVILKVSNILQLVDSPSQILAPFLYGQVCPAAVINSLLTACSP